MPLKELGKKKEKRDFKQEFLETIANNYGLQNAIIMEDALGEQKKQLQVAMHTGGMAFEDIAQSKGIDLLGELMKNQGSVKAVGESEQPQQDFKRAGNWLSRPMQVNTQTGQMLPAELLGGLLQSHPDDLLKMAQAQSQMQKQQPISPEQQVSTLTKTQELLKQLGVNAGVNVTATGVPSITTQPALGMEDLSQDKQVQAYDLARRIAGVRGAAKLVPSIAQGLREGKNIDQIEDELRFSQQSPEFAGTMREAAQQINIGESKEISNRMFDYLDDLVQRGDQETAKSFLKRMAVKNAGQTQQQNIMGQERTIDLLGEIQTDLQTLEKEGFPTGFWSGKIENLMGKVGQVKNPKHRELATKIAVTVMQYRRDMTGVQFGMKEHAEYKTVFPGIDKIGRFNMAAIKALSDTFGGNVNKFYSLSMGEKNYKKLFSGDYKIKENGNDTSILNRLGLDPSKYEIVR